MNATVILFICLRVLSSLFMILLFAGIIVSIFNQVSPRRFRRREIRKLPAMRFARGEIDADTYRAMTDDLEFLK